MVHKLIIIGGGPAGLTSGIYASRAGLEPLLFQGTCTTSQLVEATTIENWPGEKKINGRQLLQNLQNQAESFGTKIIDENVVKVDFKSRPFTIWSSENNLYQAKTVIAATGSTPKRLHCPGESEYWSKGIGICASCDGPFFKDKHVIIVGGGEHGVQNALKMLNYTHKITLVQNLSFLTSNRTDPNTVLNDENIDIIFNSTISKIEGDGEHITSATIQNLLTGQIQNIRCEGIFVSIGTIPNSNIFQDQLELTQKGRIICQENTQTTKEGVFAAGDVVDELYRQAIVSSAAGCMAALDAARYLKTLKK